MSYGYGMTTTDTPSAPVRPTFNEYSGYWVLTDSPYNNEWNDGVLVVIDGADSEAGYDDEATGEYVVTEANFHCTFVNGPRRSVHTDDRFSTYLYYGYGSVPAHMLRRPNRYEVKMAEDEAFDAMEAANRALEEAQHVADRTKNHHALLEVFLNGYDGDDWESHVVNHPATD
jgi:hypothetical protein